MHLISVILTSYNWSEALELSIKSLWSQHDKDFEIIIADDGSTEQVLKKLSDLIAKSPIPMQLVTQSDQGFRAAKIRNKAIAVSKGDHLIFLDGDCIVFPGFISEHRSLAEEDFFVVGNRVMLRENFSRQVINSMLAIHQRSIGYFFWLRVSGRINRFHTLLPLPLGRFRYLKKSSWQGAKTCNLAVWREDLLAINGFDESYEGWGYEDSDLVSRLFRYGIGRKTGRFSVPVLHLWHRGSDRSKAQDNLARLKEKSKEGSSSSSSSSSSIVSNNGLNQYLEVDGFKKIQTLSVIIITMNEEDNIRDCLESVKWADEIIIVDSGSGDETLTVAQEYTDKIFINSQWQGFGYQKNLALSKATCDWVFSIDADERVTEALQREIKESIYKKTSVYEVPRRAFFLGKELKHGGWWPDYVVRLFRRGKGQYKERLVHEVIEYEGVANKLNQALIHYSYVSFEQVLSKMSSYAIAGASEAKKNNKTGGFAKAILRGSWAFFNAYFIRLGFLDGEMGFIAAMTKGEGTYYRYLILTYENKNEC